MKPIEFMLENDDTKKTYGPFYYHIEIDATDMLKIIKGEPMLLFDCPEGYTIIPVEDE